MLPVSGAEQLKGSAPMAERPMISHSGAYSRLVRPAPYLDSGRKRFHSPAAWAFSLSASITGAGCQALPEAAGSVHLGLELGLGGVDMRVHEGA